METRLTTNATIQLTILQLTDLAKQLPKKERLKLAAALIDEDEPLSKAALVTRIRQGLDEVKQYKAGKITLKSAREFLNEL